MTDRGANHAVWALRSLTTLTRPVPLQGLQMRRLPRSRMRPVPQHCTQVSWAATAGRSLCIENLFPKTIRISFAFHALENECDSIAGALSARRGIA
jgi:hypothetical protein